MKRELEILTVMLVLFTGPVVADLHFGVPSEPYPVWQESNTSPSVAGIGWIDDSFNFNPKEINNISHSFYQDGALLEIASRERGFQVIFHLDANPLLLDRPPPDVLS